MKSTESTSTAFTVLNRRPGEWLSTLPMFIFLLATLVIGTGEMFHGQLLRLGEKFFGDPTTGVQYFLLRADPTAPDCDPNVNIDAKVAQLTAGSSGGTGGIDDLFADAPKDPVAIRHSVEQAQQLCKDKFKMYESIRAHITPGLKAYRAVETSFFVLFHFGVENRALLLLLIMFFASITTTLQRHHIALRPAHSVLDFRLQALSMLAGNCLILASVIAHYNISLNSGVAIDKPIIFYMWMALFGSQVLLSFYHLLTMPESAQPGGSIGKALLAVPLYAVMAQVGGIYFLLHQHWGGLSIYINQMMELSGIFLNLALYIWIGMLLKQTRFVDMFLDVLRPWKLSPEALTYFILLAAAYPTAYTGASAIFVIAAGSLIYHEVRRAGGNAQFALAASAMSGSLGVVLRPCLLVVLIAALNKQVRTAELYHWGGYVFLLTSTLFFIISQFYRTQKVQIANPVEAIKGMLENIKPLIPYIVLVVIVALFYQLALNTKLDEFTAPVIIPVVMLVLVLFDQWKRQRELTRGKRLESWMLVILVIALVPMAFVAVKGVALQSVDFSAPGFLTKLEGVWDWVTTLMAPVLTVLMAVLVVVESVKRFGGNAKPAVVEHVPEEDRPVGIEKAMRLSTHETIGHVGALIILMALSLAMGGMVERSGVMEHAPHHFPNIWVAMGFLTVSKVLLGMIMDPFGAVILVSGTLAPIAYAAGIEPVHFWMMVLVAFELGYLLPPVALNQLFLRQVVGDDVIDKVNEESKGKPFMRRYERWLLPIMVISIGLVIVAFGPLLLTGH